LAAAARVPQCGREGASAIVFDERFFKPDTVASIAAGGTAGPYKIKFSANRAKVLWVVGMICSVRSGADVDMSSLRVKITDEEGACLITNGEAATYVPFAEISPKSAPWFLFAKAKPVQAGMIWNVEYINDTAATAIVPSISVRAIEGPQ
jgi:hypothetical protein